MMSCLHADMFYAAGIPDLLPVFRPLGQKCI